MPTVKYCQNCKKEHPIEEFSENHLSSDGYRHKCKKHYKEKSMIRRTTNFQITELIADLEAAKKENQVSGTNEKMLVEQIEVLSLKCDIAEKKKQEAENKYDILVQDLKDSGNWPVKG